MVEDVVYMFWCDTAAVVLDRHGDALTVSVVKCPRDCYVEARAVVYSNVLYGIHQEIVEDLPQLDDVSAHAGEFWTARRR